MSLSCQVRAILADVDEESGALDALELNEVDDLLFHFDDVGEIEALAMEF